MLKSYLVISVRHLIKNRLFSLINILGLALGMASFILIFSYVRYEHSYDQINSSIDDIYRVESIFYKAGLKTDHWPTSTNGAGLAMQESFPDVMDMTRINWHDSDRIVRYQNRKFRENHVCFADANFFSFFDYKVIKGDRISFLLHPNTVILSESAAKKYFGSADPMGKRMQFSTFSNSFDCEVTGVFADLPRNHTMQFDFLISWKTSGRWMWDFWYLHESYTYVKLSEHAVLKDIEENFSLIAEKYKTRPTLKDHTWAIDLVSLREVHLNPAKPYEIEAKGNSKAVDFLLLISFVILVIAWANYINLSTAQALNRAREVGIRKVAGSHKSQLATQFLFESALVNIMAGIISLAIIYLTAWLWPILVDNSFSLDLLIETSFMFIFICIVTVGSILSGLYPSLVLARYQPASVLKGKYGSASGGDGVRRGLVIFQLAISIVLIGSSMIVRQQVSFMKSQHPGINIKQTMVIEAPVINDNYQIKMQSFKNELINMNVIEAVTRSSAIPGKEVAKFLANRYEYAAEDEQRLCEMLKVDFDFIDTYELKLTAGRNFDKEMSTDSIALILNQAAVAQFGFASDEEAVNKRIILEGTPDKRNHIIGVVKNYHQQSLKKDHTPIIFFMDPDYGWIPITYFSLKLNTNDLQKTIAQIQEHWNIFFPESSFDYFFLDEFFNRQYLADQQYGKTISTFTILAIAISCMGLFGLTIFSVSNRTKEIGIRKVLGASVYSIFALLNIELVKLILISSIIGIPMSFFIIQKWLDGYAFKINLSWWVFGIPVIVVMVIAVLSTSFLTIRAARTNPAQSLRSE